MSLIYLIAPSGYCLNQDAAKKGVNRLEEAGHIVENQKIIARRYQRFAGTDAERLADINQIAELSDTYDIVMAIRGGYGASRLLEYINYPRLRYALRTRQPIICGHSDFTAIQLALLAQCGTITFSGPMLAGNFGADEPDTFTWHHFWQAVRQKEFCLSWQNGAPACETEGTLWGGNLAMLASLIGSPWLPAIEGGILVVEDINEHPFRIERMLLQLHHAGILSRQSALILGSFSGYSTGDYDNGYNFDQMCDVLRQRLSIPVISGLPFGHESQTVTLPLGAFAHLMHDGQQCKLTISGHPVIT